ncbi:condensation domain-containing protein [Chryseolinea serpens]|uniref:condensation domain-containing protein n=1 Tax=Chryseolinea serpens TaxID=947013 RepID=UPI0015B829F8|nr:condensation domain-containing protein [Chryseolinea serpens]
MDNHDASLSMSGQTMTPDTDFNGAYQNQVGKVLYFHYFSQFQSQELLVKEVQSFNINESFILENINVNAFEQAVAGLMARHESLRTVFQCENGEVRQRILTTAECGLPITYFDVRHETDKMEAKDRLGHACWKTRFDFYRGPLFKAVVVRVEDTVSWVFLAINHVVCDIYSLYVLREDFYSFYSALAQDTSPVLPPQLFQARDYAAWQHKLFDAEDKSGIRKFWIDSLWQDLPRAMLKTFYKDAAPRVEHAYAAMIEAGLRADGVKDYQPLARALNGYCNRPLPTKGSGYSFCLDEDLFQDFKALSVTLSTTMNNLVTTALSLMVHALTGRTDIILAVSASTRDHYKLQRIVGWLMNYMLVRYTLREEHSVARQVAVNQQTFLKVMPYKHYPIDYIFRELDISLDSLGTFFVNYIKHTRDRDDIDPPRHLTGDTIVTADVDCTVNEFENCFRIFFNYKTEFFLPSTIEFLAQSFLDTCRYMVRNPDEPLWSLKKNLMENSCTPKS